MFRSGFSKIASIVDSIKNTYNKIPAKHLDHAGLATLAIAPAVHGYKAIKNKDKKEAALAGSEIAGLGLLHAAVKKAH